jgi:excisionase family DNA binding protein
MGEVSVREAATQLGVHQSRVRELLASGRLSGRRVGPIWLVNEESVARQKVLSADAHGRPMSTRIAWSASAWCDGMETTWLTASDRSRLRRRLRSHTAQDVHTYRWWLQTRSTLTRYRVADSDIGELVSSPGVVAGGISAASVYELGLGHGAEAEVYANPSVTRWLIEEFFLIESDQGNLALRIVDDTTPWHQMTARVAGGLTVAPRLIVAADLLDSSDTRSRSAGTQLLTAAVTSAEQGQPVAP